MSEAAQEAEVNPDGSTTFDEVPPAAEGMGDTTPPVDGEGFAGDEFESEMPMEEQKFAVDPAIFLLIGVAIIIGLYYFFVIKKKKQEDEDDFFANLDGEKVRRCRLVFVTLCKSSDFLKLTSLLYSST
jgi:hypothetical protein